MGVHILTGTSAPSSAPTEIGQHYVDTVNEKFYISVDTSSVSDWLLMNAPTPPTFSTTVNEYSVAGGTTQDIDCVAGHTQLFLISGTGTGTCTVNYTFTNPGTDAVYLLYTKFLGDNASVTFNAEFNGTDFTTALGATDGIWQIDGSDLPFAGGSGGFIKLFAVVTSGSPDASASWAYVYNIADRPTI